jgi:DNA-binding Lrp family transcriptional regulator
MTISATDYEVLTHILNDPMASISDASKSIGLAPRTVSRSLKRLKERHRIRFACLVDVTAFGLQSVILFFSVKDQIDWPALSDGLATFPFTKSIVTTDMSELGYVVFLIPNSERNQVSFIESIDDLAASVFDYHSVHIREAVGAESNLSLYAGDRWQFPEKFQTSLTDADVPVLERPPRFLRNKGLQKGFTSNDFLVASKLAIDCRATPGTISETLQTNGWDIEPRQVSHSIRKLFSRDAVLPYAIFGGLSLSTSFCFEIICEDAWKQRILSALPHLPTSMYYFSNRGVLLWIQVPGEHQVEYYQTFRSLEQNNGVHTVHPIMTISALGSRSMLDLVTNWSYGAQGWTTSTDELDIATYLEQFDIDGQERSRADLYS